jgi:hypothetical protein
MPAPDPGSKPAMVTATGLVQFSGFNRFLLLFSTIYDSFPGRNRFASVCSADRDFRDSDDFGEEISFFPATRCFRMSSNRPGQKALIQQEERPNK